MKFNYIKIMFQDCPKTMWEMQSSAKSMRDAIGIRNLIQTES